MSVLAFIILGSIIRQINLLVLLSGLMIAPFFFNWRISKKMMERLAASRRLPEWVNAATPFNVHWEIANHRKRIPSWGVRIVDHVIKSGEDPKKAEQITVLAPPVAADTKVDVTYRCLMPGRGLYEFGPATISSAFPVGLLRSRIGIEETGTLVVAPRLGKLTGSWDRIMRSQREGDTFAQRQRSVNEGEFYGIRPWTSGDNPRQVHWRSSARHGELMVRQFEQQMDNQLVILLDLFKTDMSQTDVEYTLSFFATILDRYCRERVKPGVGVFGDQTINVRKCDRIALQQVMGCLATVQPAEENGLSAAVRPWIENARRKDRLIILSTRNREDAIRQDRMESFSCLWIDVSSDGGHHFFQPTADDTNRFVQKIIGSGDEGES